MSILGNRVRRTEDARFIKGVATYGDDLDLDNAVHVTFVRSQLPHARVVSIDTSGVSEIEGAQAFTATDLGLGSMPVPLPMLNQEMPRPYLSGDVVRHTGEPVAVVVTEDRMRGDDAAEQVLVELEELPAVASPEEALKE
ncbi:MAG TPA: hypothetical protein VGI54_03825, partial [Solirubrobacteraceae bacterium]